MKKYTEGYMSVEAAFIVSWTFFIVVIMIYIGFFEYDRCMLFQDGYTAAVGTACRVADKKEKQNLLNGYLQELYGDKYVAAETVDKSGTVTSNKIKIKSGFTLKLILGSNGLAAQKHLSASDSITADNYSFSRRIRIFRAAERVLNGG